MEEVKLLDQHALFLIEKRDQLGIKRNATAAYLTNLGYRTVNGCKISQSTLSNFLALYGKTRKYEKKEVVSSSPALKLISEVLTSDLSEETKTIVIASYYKANNL
jgi:hypothetical protein